MLLILNLPHPKNRAASHISRKTQRGWEEPEFSNSLPMVVGKETVAKRFLRSETGFGYEMAEAKGGL